MRPTYFCSMDYPAFFERYKHPLFVRYCFSPQEV
jgi:hypothetical protein